MRKFGKCLIPLNAPSFANLPYDSAASDLQILPACRNFGNAPHTRQLFQRLELLRSLERYQNSGTVPISSDVSSFLIYLGFENFPILPILPTLRTTFLFFGGDFRGAHQCQRWPTFANVGRPKFSDFRSQKNKN